jgi:hypothetical protein
MFVDNSNKVCVCVCVHLQKIASISSQSNLFTAAVELIDLQLSRISQAAGTGIVLRTSSGTESLPQFEDVPSISLLNSLFVRTADGSNCGNFCFQLLITF